jgi:hypothetical protein
MNPLELKRCPFCGVLPEIAVWFYHQGWRARVWCQNPDCGSKPASYATGSDKENARKIVTAQWNVRN